jgi:hypothetical protein
MISFGGSKVNQAKAMFFLLTVLGGLGAGCGRTETVPRTKEALETRCRAYWQLRLKGDWGGVYDFLVPEERKFVSRDQFVNDRSKQLSFREYQLVSTEVKENTGITNVQCKWRVQLPGDSLPFRDGQETLVEHWLYLDGGWYLQMLSPSRN